MKKLSLLLFSLLLALCASFPKPAHAATVWNSKDDFETHGTWSFYNYAHSAAYSDTNTTTVRFGTYSGSIAFTGSSNALGDAIQLFRYFPFSGATTHDSPPNNTGAHTIHGSVQIHPFTTANTGGYVFLVDSTFTTVLCAQSFALNTTSWTIVGCTVPSTTNTNKDVYLGVELDYQPTNPGSGVYLDDGGVSWTFVP